MSRLHLSFTPFPICTSFFFNDTATPEIYTLSLHDALPILTSTTSTAQAMRCCSPAGRRSYRSSAREIGRSTRLNSSHQIISYAVFCLKKKKNTYKHTKRHDTRRAYSSRYVTVQHIHDTSTE